NPNAGQEYHAVAQSQPSSSTLPVPSTSSPPVQSTPTPIPASIPTPIPIPETEPEPFEHTFEEPSPGTWKLSQLNNLSFEEVKEEFDKLVKQSDEAKDDEPTKKSGKRRKQMARK
ncbi:hypothetical protein Tco_0181949, partial [Tanacetum coccineum]